MKTLPPPTDPTWRTRAACRDEDTELFFDEDRQAEAQQVCAACPVRTDCFDAALATYEKYGVWGGATTHARTVERRRRLRGREPHYPAPPPPKEVASPPARVDATGSVRRLQALRADGHRTSDIAETALCSVKTMSAWCHTDRRRIDASLASSISRAYRDLAGQPPGGSGPGLGPEGRRSRAAARGWVPSTRWAGIDLDDPRSRPHPDASETAA
ncbi:WhiB family transcriptional regulator [Nocardiopsis sp. HNM0947]|uniref:Transcriptional regulator WhiB n=1 Tax=Nocardiopsis coralli TaxID=2772213 RepID=A0ABR9P4I7_9ACTN|nr:WhiB family transcriptional regulator [Nocardiopsis coralli]